MVKEPRAGAVKSRLAKHLGAGRTVSFYRTLMSSTLRRIARDPRWHTVLAVAPDTALHARVWPAGVDIMAQGRGNLGARMSRIMASLPPGPVIIVGSDIPDITPDEIRTAFDRLGAADAVFGPAPDGGYWLVGMKRCPRVLDPFSHVRWSSPDALADTVANLRGRKVVYVAEHGDIDTIDDYLRWRRT